jgi:hypothetical protein
VRLPRLGNQIKLTLSGPGWEPEQPVPQFSGEPIKLPSRIAVVRLRDPGKLGTLRKLGPFDAGNPRILASNPPPLIFDPPVPFPPGASEVKWMLGPVGELPHVTEPTVELLFDTQVPNQAGPADFFREGAYFNTDLRNIWVQPDTAIGHPIWGLALKGADGKSVDALVHVTASIRNAASGGPGDRRAVVFQRQPIERPGWVTVVIPTPTDVEKWTAKRQRLIAHLLVYATSLAGRKGASQPIATTEVFLPPDAAAAPPIDVKTQSSRVPLAQQVFDALWNDRDAEPLEDLTNHIGGEVQEWSADLLAGMIGGMVVIAIVRRIHYFRELKKM